MLCTDLTFVKVVANRIYAEPLTCRRWSCNYCRPRRKRQLIAKAASGQPDTFITLTSSPRTGKTPFEAARRLVIAWREVRREARKRYGYAPIQFIAVFEATKRGRPHLHILARCTWIDQAWLSDRMAHHAAAPIVDIRRVAKVSDVVRYLFKYIGKAPHQFGTCKRYWTSQKYELQDGRRSRENEAPADACRVVHRRFSLYLMDAERDGYSFELEGDGAWLTWGRSGPEPPW